MHTNRISPARKILFWLGSLLGLFVLTGCDFTLANLTPATMPENPSSIYTIQARAVPKAATIVKNSTDARIVIDNQDVERIIHRRADARALCNNSSQSDTN